MAAEIVPPERLLEHVRAHWNGIRPNSPIYDLFFKDLRIVAATPGRIRARLPELAHIHINSKNVLHGAVSAALVDWAGGMAIASTGRTSTGVSVDIHVSYVSAARAGDGLEVEAWVQRAGRTLAYTTVEIRKLVKAEGPTAGDGDGGDDPEPTKGPVVAAGSHTKYLNVPGQ
ncbi:thioesterase family protein [Niveomyces insectorum RCEF 264]|uniref:Thioesterase family protein n=1 Tax=Niveomyces insectorum RCEF 264 TaxID=1081102 RepID=A0A167Y3X6_9HYPO|nr:thioesterase family protein [Niveomyces insectorum RCEF 264]